jgi:diguanylate cyclase (GGDEF)-like protein
VGAPGWWLQALLLFCVGWPLGLLLACFGRAHARVQALATQDLLTSLANGRQFEAQLAALAQQASGGGAPFGLVAFDLEGVKEVNVLLGRDAGDAMLAEFGRRLRRALRHGDVPARSGGHEFAALLLGVPDAQTLQPLIQRVLGTVQGPLQWRGHALELRCRHGAACWSEAQGRLDDLRALTDRRLRAAPAAQRDGPWVNPLPTPPRPPSTRSRASDQG